jgi:hypothetical protein
VSALWQVVVLWVTGFAVILVLFQLVIIAGWRRRLTELHPPVSVVDELYCRACETAYPCPTLLAIGITDDDSHPRIDHAADPDSGPAAARDERPPG